MRNNCRWKPKAIVIFFFLFSCLLGNAQISSGIPLKEILPELEERFGVRFSYLDKDLEDIKVILPEELKELDEILKNLQEQTSLVFIPLDKRYIAIKKTEGNKLICLVLRDSKTGVVLSGAGIFDKKGNLLSFTNEKGQVFIEEDDDLRLIFRHLGYNPVELEPSRLSNDKCNEIFMISFVEVLGESVVVNYLTSGVSKRRDGSTVIHTENFGSLPGMVEPDILHMIEALPGVESGNETISSINIRGGTSDQNLVLYDGVKMYLTGHFFGLISAFNAGLTNKAGLIKNGTSAEFSDGVSGTIDIGSKNEITGNFSGGAGLSLVSADAHLQIPLAKNLEVHLSGRRSIHDFYRSPTFGSYFSRAFQESEVFTEGDQDPGEDADFNFHDYSGKIIYDISEGQRLRFSGLVIENELNYSDPSSRVEDGDKRVNSLTQKNLVMGGTWTSSWSDTFETSVQTYFTRYRLWAQDEDAATQQSLIQSNEVLETGAKFDLLYHLNENFDFHGGYQFSEVGVSNIELVNNPFYSSRIKNVLRSHALFSEVSMERDRFFLRGGLRLNYLEKQQEYLVEPRLNINYKISPVVNLKLQAEQKSQTLSQIIDLQEDFLGVENRRWILANGRDFPVIRSNQISSGIDFRSAGWFVDLVVYYKKVSGINTSTQGFRDQHEFWRTNGSYDSKGLELLINKRFDDLQVYMNYTLAESSYEFPALEPSRFPNNFDIRHSFSFALNQTLGKLKVSLGGKLASGRPYTAPVQGEETWREGNIWYVNYDLPNAEILPLYFRMDASASYKFKVSDRLMAKISGGILNITDRKNVINRYYVVSGEDTSTAVKVDERSLGFTPNVLLRIDF
jgi:hypothetical protein